MFERILEIEPDRVPSSRGSSPGNLIERGFADRAEPFAKRALESRARRARTLRAAGVGVPRAAARRRAGRHLPQPLRAVPPARRRGQARDILQRFVPTDELRRRSIADACWATSPSWATSVSPGRASLPWATESRRWPATARRCSTRRRSSTTDASTRSSRAEPVALQDLAEETLLELADGGGFLDPPTDEIPIPRQLAQALAPPAPEITGDPEQLLAEASVYLRYGKRDQAIANLEAILAADPGAPRSAGEARRGLRGRGRAPKAVETWLRAAEMRAPAGDDEGVAVLRDRIAALDEAAAATLGIGAAEPEERGRGALGSPATPGRRDSARPRSLRARSRRPSGGRGPRSSLDDIEIDIDGSEFADEIAPVRRRPTSGRRRQSEAGRRRDARTTPSDETTPTPPTSPGRAPAARCPSRSPRTSRRRSST